jgi:hypothetical protein
MERNENKIKYMGLEVPHKNNRNNITIITSFLIRKYHQIKASKKS